LSFPDNELGNISDRAVNESVLINSINQPEGGEDGGIQKKEQHFGSQAGH
jgi:hypothetical protein